MSLFRELDRSDRSFRRREESSFEYLDRSARSDCTDFRRILKESYAAIPSIAQANVMAKFTSKDDGKHVGALLELGLFSILRATATSVDFEPAIDGQTPDFLVRFTDTEVVMDVTALAPETTSNASRSVQKVIGKLEEIDLHGYFVDAYIKKLVDYDTKITRLRKSFEAWINSLAFLDTPCSELPWDDGSWRILFVARKYDGIPNERNQITDYALEDLSGCFTSDVDESFRARIRKKVRDKSDSYGGLDKALVVAVISVGTEAYINSIPIQKMLFDNAWKRPKVSAVLCKPVSNPWALYSDNRPWELVHNPFAKYPLEKGLFSFACEHVYESGEWGSHPPATSARSILGLPAKWDLELR